MQRITCNNREYVTITDVDEVVPGKVLGFRADHDFSRGPANLVVIPVSSPQPAGPRLFQMEDSERENDSATPELPAPATGDAGGLDAAA